MTIQSERLRHGRRGAYHWLTSSQHHLHDLIALCPQLVLGKFIAITSFDSGPRRLSEDEIAHGWRSDGNVAYSPLIRSAQSIPYDWYDEWYVLETQRNIGRVLYPDGRDCNQAGAALEVFVNYFAFAIGSEEFEAKTEVLWKQLDAVHPYCYVADGDLLTIVTADEDLFSSVLTSFR